MKRVLQTLTALAALGAVGAAAVVGFGLYNVSARAGHFPGVSWVLHTTYEQSVRLRAPSADEVPDDLALADRTALGAGHFATACAFCHATPDTAQSATALSMNPPPPHIRDAVAVWQPEHLFWIVREGVKMSGMPHWPAEGRDEEIWSVVAYLNAVGRGDAVPVAADVTCATCHGEEGRSRNIYVPRLDLLGEDYIAAALTQYRDGSRPSGMMEQAARGLTDAQIARLAANFAGPAPVGTLPDASSVAMELATRGSTDVPACTACHGPGRDADARPAPVIAGQSRAYLETQLHLWRDGKRGGGERAELMRKAAKALSDEQIEMLADWFSGLVQD